MCSNYMTDQQQREKKEKDDVDRVRERKRETDREGHRQRHTERHRERKK
jgi:ribosomal protein L21